MSESQSHIQVKQKLYKWLNNDSNVTKLALERHLGDCVPDISFCWQEKYYAAIEIQFSRISPDEVEERTKRLSDKGIHTLWVTGFGEAISQGIRLWQHEAHCNQLQNGCFIFANSNILRLNLKQKYNRKTLYYISKVMQIKAITTLAFRTFNGLRLFNPEGVVISSGLHDSNKAVIANLKHCPNKSDT